MTIQEIDYQQILLQLCASITLADHMGDVSEDVFKALTLAGVDLTEVDEWSELGTHLGKLGVTTLYGTSMAEDE